MSDCNEFLNYFTNKLTASRSNISPSSSQYQAYNLLTSDTWSAFTPITLQDILMSFLPHFSLVCLTIGPCILEMINISLLTGSVPSFFKQAVFEPILKKPNLDPSFSNSYRPISKLLFISKILERNSSRTTELFPGENDVMDVFQSGFHNWHSTKRALLKVSSDILMAAHSREYTVLVLLDLTTAFDTGDHSIIINKLKDISGLRVLFENGSCPIYLKDIFCSYKSSHQLFCHVGQILGDLSWVQFSLYSIYSP